MKGILGRKLGMTQVFTKDGTLVPVTVIEVTPNVVMQKKTIENDGYEAVQLGFEDVKKANKARTGHAAKAEATAKRFLREIRGNGMMNFDLGANVTCDIFESGELVDVSGISKGKGFTGAVVRNNQTLGPASHGSGHHRGLGSLASIGRNNGIINKGRVMAGQEGVYATTNQNLVIVKADPVNNYILVRGNVPGPRRGLVVVKSAVKKGTNLPAFDLVDYTVE